MIHVASGLQNFRAVMQQQFPLRCDLKPLSASFFPRKVSPVANATGPAISCVRGGPPGGGRRLLRHGASVEVY
jgi:hypothetical protein